MTVARWMILAFLLVGVSCGERAADDTKPAGSEGGGCYPNKS